jgi:tetratricopeptide (TPR) repeat protein
MIVKIVLIFAGLVAGSTAALSAALRSDTESCLSHSLPDDQQIAACSAAIRSSKQDNRAKGLALLERAGAYGRRGEYGRAIADTTQAIRTAPSAEAYYTRALAYQNMGEDQRAIRDCNAALAIEPKNENALFVRGSARQNLEDYLGATEDFSDVLQLNPSRAPARFARGTAYYSAGDYKSAVADFSKAIDLGLTDAAIFRMRALAEAELGRPSADPRF